MRFPDIICGAHLHACVVCTVHYSSEMSTYFAEICSNAVFVPFRTEYLFNFDDAFEIHDDIEVLQRMGMALGESDRRVLVR